MKKKLKQVLTLEKAPLDWRETMSRSAKAMRNRWNTVIKGTPKTPKTVKTDGNNPNS